MTETPKCSSPGCSRRISARGMCIHHYQEKWRAGELAVTPRLPQRMRELEARLRLVEEQLARLEKESA